MVIWVSISFVLYTEYEYSTTEGFSPACMIGYRVVQHHVYSTMCAMPSSKGLLYYIILYCIIIHTQGGEIFFVKVTCYLVALL